MFYALALALALAPAADKPPTLPDEWHGTWVGKLTIHSDDRPSEVPLTLEVQPAKGGAFTWKLTYGDGDKKVVKDYKLVPTEKAGRFVLDEGGGVELPVRLVNGVMYCHFETSEQVLTARYELREKVLRFEVTSAKAGEKTGGGKVQPYPVASLQTAELKPK